MMITNTTTAITITDMAMKGRKKNIPLVRGRDARKRSQHLSPRAGRRRPSEARSGEASSPETQVAERSSVAGGKTESRVAPSTLYRLMAWLSPSYPVGAFSYSSGSEWAVEQGDIKDTATFRDWLAVVMGEGSGFCDAIFFVQAHGAVVNQSGKLLREVAELAAAFSPSKERHLETSAQGRAFVEATRAAWPCAALDRLVQVWNGPVAYPVAVAVTAAGHGIAVEPALHAYLHALVANWISAGVRLIPLGQTDGQRVLAALEPIIAQTAARALAASLDEIGSAAFRADIASMRHETQYTRLFRS